MKKIISLILAFSMCVSLLPATVLFASAAGETVYTFSTTALNSKNGKNGTGTDVYYRDTNIYKNTSGAVDNFNLKYVCGTGNHGWKYFGHTAVPADVVLGMRHMRLMDTGILSTINNASYGAVTQLDLAFELEQPTKGFYTVSYENDVSSGVTGYIGAKKSSAISDYINEKHLLGNVTTANAVTAYPGKVIYSDGVTPLVYAFRTTTNVTTKSLTLKTNNGTVSFAIEDTGLNVGDTTTASVKVGNDVLVDSFVEYSVPVNSCITVDGLGNITAVSPGWTVLSVTVGDLKEKMLVGVRDANGEIPGEEPSLETDPSFPYSFIHAGEKVQIVDADSSFAFSSSDTAVATVDANGLITAIKPGKTTVTATKGELVKTFEVPVVGENLINRAGNDHSHFEQGVYFTDGTGAQNRDDTFWEATRAEENYVFDYELVYGNALPGRKDVVPAAKFMFDGNGTPSNGRISLRLQSAQHAPGNNKNSGAIAADKKKIYEFTGFLAAENTELLASDISITSEYLNVNLSEMLVSSNVKPWKDRTGNQSWGMFTVPSVIMSESGESEMMIRPWLQTVMATKVGDILFTEFSVHEVVYAGIELSAERTEISASETIKLSAKHYSNTGNIIKQQKGTSVVDADVAVDYKSSDAEIVRVVDNDGTIIGVSDGTAIITATATICGVTVSEEIEITVSGGERPEFIGSMELAIQGENIYPASYANAYLTVKNEAGEAMTLSSDELTYESSDTGVATVTSNGVIRAKTAGTATITATAKKNGLTKTATALLTVSPFPAEENFPEVIGAYFTNDYTYVGGENTVIVTDLYGRKLGGGITYAYEIADDSVISEENGVFTGKKVGRTTVKISATLDGVTRYTEVPAVVVGNNLLIRKGVNHGEFENGIYLNDGSTDTVKNSSFWTGAHTEKRGLFTYELLKNKLSEITGAPTNVVKFVMPGGTTTDNLKLIRIQGTTDAFNPSDDKHIGIIAVETGKLYEYSGYIKAENVKDLPENACGTLAYYSGSGANAAALASAYKSSPWVGKSGEQKWTKFNLSPVLMNWEGVSSIGIQPGFDVLTNDENRGYDFLVSHFSVHEVVFDRIVFSVSGNLENAKTYDTFETKVAAVSNTGTEILIGNTAKNIEYTYRSEDESIARISEDGVITAVSNGTTKVYATATILGVTKTAELEMTFSGLDVMFDRIEADVPEEMKVGEGCRMEPVYICTDDSPYTGESEIYYESEDPSVVYIDKNGYITAKKAGKTVINAFVLVGERIVKHTFNIKVNDVTPLVYVSISGKNTVEEGFSIKLEALAEHESGSTADMEDCSVKFEVADPASEAIIDVSENGEVTGVVCGTAYVKVTVTAPDSEKTSEPFEITVVPKSPKSKVFDFTTYPVNTSVLNATIEKDGFEIDREFSSTNILSGQLNALRYLAYGISSNVGNFGNNQKSDTVLDVKIDYDGWYEIDIKTPKISSGAALAYAYMDGVYIGKIRFYNTQDISDGPSVQMNTAYLDADVHRLTIRSIEPGVPELAIHTCNQAISRITFNYIEEEPEVQKPIIDIERTSLAVGESSKIAVTVPMSNGREHNFGLRHGNKEDKESNLKITSSDENVVKYENGRLIATGTGTAVIKASALVYNKPAESTMTITVTDEALSHIENLNADGITLYVGDVADIELRAFVDSETTEEREISVDDLVLSYELEGDNIATVADKKITATAVGNASLVITATLGGKNPITSYIPVSVIEDGYAQLELGAVTQVIKYGGAGTDLYFKIYDNFGNEIVSDEVIVRYESSDERIVFVDANGKVFPGEIGVATVKAYATFNNITHSDEISISVRNGKIASTYYTAERVEAARKNAKLYDWAKAEKEKAVEKADKYLPHVDAIYNMMPNHNIPRSVNLGEAADPILNTCPYCDAKLHTIYGNFPWALDMLTRPWKIQCKECKRLFPSNDFESFYNNGLDENHEFNRQLALENNGILCERGERNEKGEYVVDDQYADNPYGYGDPKGNLYNETYTELYPDGSLDPRAKKPITQGWGDFKTGGESGVPSAGYFWGVDDGFGYNTGRIYEANGVAEIHRYIAVANYEGLWYIHGDPSTPVIHAAITAFRDAYLYTGEKKYGIAGAKILDRIADLYPDFHYGVDCENLVTSGNGSGKISGYIHENFVNRPFTTAYDAFFDCYDEPELIEYCSQKAKEWNLDNKKTNGELLRQNVEDNILYETYNAVGVADIRGNFGMKHETLIKAAIILDRDLETSEMIDLAMRSGIDLGNLCTGAGLYAGIMNRIDRDGYADESALPYNSIFTSSFVNIIKDMDIYGKVDLKYDLVRNPKVISALTLGADTILAGSRNANIGDADKNFAATGILPVKDAWLFGFQKTGNPLFAQLLYLTNGNTAEGIAYDIFTENPESPEKDIQQAIDKYGELELSESNMLTGYGFAALRGGVLYDDVTAATMENTMRDFWMYFGTSHTWHKHQDSLNLGIDAFGLNMAPDLGYEGAIETNQQLREHWTMGSVSHNVVLVDDMPQSRWIEGIPLHFDDAGAVQVMDVESPDAYPEIAETYRRTVVSVDVDDTVSYALDFFRVKGGDEHLYSFHSQSHAATVTGVTLEKQPRGSYAGVDVPYGDLTYPKDNGYNWLENIERAVYPGTGEFTADFKITDYNRVLPGKRNLHLKLTQLNAFELSEIALADGRPIKTPDAPEYIDYLLVRRSGKNLDTLFTSVIEPYEDNSKIKSLTRVDVVRKDGGEIAESDAVAAVRVELYNGRVDYVVYSARNDVEYRVADLFDFTGFVGVYSVSADNSEDVVRTYINDGTKIGDTTAERAAVTGTVVDFTDYLNYEDGEPVLDNYLEITAPADVTPESLVGRMIVVDNDGVQNGAYVITSAEAKGDNILLGTGDVNFFRSLAEDNESFVWNIECGQNYRIPMSVYTDEAPGISVSGEFATSAGSSIQIPLNVTSDREYTLIGTSLPRGMSLNSETGVLTWRPDDSQVGENHVAVTVDNGVLSDTVHFTVTVYGNTMGGSSSDKTETPGADNTGTTDTPEGGGAAPTPDAGTDAPDDDDTTQSDKTDNVGDSANTDVGVDVNVESQFTDLTNHAWAADAINSLAADGIIKGTTSTTYSPTLNITRADFALLLVRAFKLSSDNTENFADVSASDYFAPELAIARNTGIVDGIGDNRYAPHNTITRQDMIVIVYRALQKLEKEPPLPKGRGTVEDGGGILALPPTDEVASQYPDFDSVAPYAREAVSALIGAGLVNGKSGNIFPTDYTTRAEVAVLIKRILDYTK